MTSAHKSTFMAVLAALLLGLAPQIGAQDIAIHGAMSQSFMQTSDNNYLVESEDGSFSIFEMVLNTTANVDAKTRIGAQIYGREFGHLGNNHMLVDWAFGDYRWRNWMGFRAGRIKFSLGLYNTTRDIDMVRNSILMPQSVYTEDFRNVSYAFHGFEIYGSVPVDRLGSFEYHASLGSAEVDEAYFLHDVFIKVLAAGGQIPPSLGFEAKLDWAYSGSLYWNTPWEGLKIGGSFVTSDLYAEEIFATPTATLDMSLDMDLKKLYVLSAEYMRDRWTFAAEFQRLFVDIVVPDVPVFVPDVGVVLMDIPADDRRGGYYGQATYRASDLLELGIYLSVFHPDWSQRKVGTAETEQKDTALTARFDLTDSWLMKVEYHIIDGTGDLPERLNPAPSQLVKSWSMIAVKSTFYF